MTYALDMSDVSDVSDYSLKRRFLSAFFQP